MSADDEHFVNAREGIDEVIQSLIERFGAVVCSEVIYDVVQNCQGDYNASMAAMLSIVGDDEEAPSVNTPSNSQPNTLVTNNQPTQSTMSYADISQTPGTTPKPSPKQQRQRKTTQFTPQIESIIKYHNRGHRILIMMRGVPGSGKSYLAKQIVDATVGPSEANYLTHIASTDDFFYSGTSYFFERNKLGDAHEWNQKRVKQMISRGLSPVIVDNTNIQVWEMEPYVNKGVSKGYLVELVEPTTSWARNAAKCFENCRHDVPIANIKRMLDKYEYYSISGENLVKMLKISYPTHNKPPVKRNIPPVDDSAVPALMQPKTDIRRISLDEPATTTNDTQNIPRELWEPVKASSTDSSSTASADEADEAELEVNYNEKFIELEKQLEQFDEVDHAWETGENWTESSAPVAGQTSASADPKPPRPRTANQPSTSTQPTNSVSNPFLANEDWRCYTQFLPPWNDGTPSISSKPTPHKIPIETRSTFTCVEVGDTDITSKKYKVVTGTPRDINFYYMPVDEKIPNKRMLDKSSMTNEQTLMDTHRCENANMHFKALRNMFKHIAKADLLEIFEKCNGDVHWAAEIVLNGTWSTSIETTSKDVESDDEDVSEQQCTCDAAYEIVPNVREETNVETKPVEEIHQLLLPKKSKKEKVVSENSIQLKRQIEKNIVLGNDHYSPHVLKIRNIRHGEPASSATGNSEDTPQKEDNGEPQAGTSKQLEREKSDDESNGSDNFEEETVNINLGYDFIKKLDTIFDRENVAYTENIAPTICIPLSTLKEINALWLESLTNQIDGQAELFEFYTKQDEELARALQVMEQEFASRGVELIVPGLKEIMDMENALVYFQRDVDKIIDQGSTTLAEKMSKNKLFAMFPDISQEALSQMLMAHDNNFRNAVVTVLVTLGKSEIVQAENGVEKFIAAKEMEEQVKRLELEKKKQKECHKQFSTEATKLDKSKLNMAHVAQLREKAYEIEASRKENHKKAHDYARRGMISVASYYHDIANMQTKKYQMLNFMAANALIQVHAANNDSSTLDLHHLHVGEAIEVLDLFIDKHLESLRNDQMRGIYKKIALFVITGRGAHSPNGAKILPAVGKRLKARGLRYNKLNAGLLSIQLTYGDKMTYQI